MPLRLYRYILGKFVSTFVAALAVFTVLFLMDQASRQVEQVASNSGSLNDFILTFVLMTPPLLAYTVPLAFLMAMIWTLEQMKQDREIVAIMATGVPPIRLLPPFLATSFVAFLAAWLITAYVGPTSFRAYNDRITDLARRSFVNDLKPGVFFDGIPGTLLLVGGFDRETGAIDGLLMVRKDLATDETGEMILARSGQLQSSNLGDKDIVLELTDGTIHPVASPEREYRSGSFRELTSTISANPVKSVLSNTKLLLAASNSQLREILNQEPVIHSEERLARYAIELHRRMAFPITILLYPFVVFPAAITLRKKGKATAFTSSILLFILSYLLFSVGSSMAREGMVSGAIGAWLPDIFLGGAGVLIFIPYWIRERPVQDRPGRVKP